MTVDADLTTEILRNIREELKATRAELKTEIAELRGAFADLRTDVGVIAMRLEGVERVLVTTVHELIPLVKGLAGRVDRLEARDPTPA